MFYRSSVALLAIAAATLPFGTAAKADTAALAQSAPLPDAAADVKGSAILVSASRSVVPIGQLAASVTVLDKDLIDRAQDLGMTELLTRTPGVTIVRNGGYGTSTTVRLRGSESGQTVVVIDGVKLNDPSNADGSYNFANLMVGDASRVEVMRGPQSILWGSQAIGGVINVVTPLPDKPLEGSMDVEAGSRETVSARGAIGGKQGPVSWRIAGQTFTTGGISALAPELGGRETDGYTNRSLQGRAEIELSSNVTADLRGYYSSGRFDFDDVGADAPSYGKTKEFVGYAGLNINLLDGRWRNRLGYGHTNTNRENYDPRRERAQTLDANGRNRRFEYEGTFAATDTVIALFGVEQEKSSFRSVSPAGSLAIPVPEPARGDAKITGVYGELSTGPFSGLTLRGGVRHDHHSRYGGKTLFSAGAAWELPTGTTLRANYGEGFKAPTLYQLFSDYGNTALGPERAHGYEGSIEQKLFDDALVFGATYFVRKTKGEIIYNGCTPGSGVPLCFQPGTTIERWGYYENISQSRARGVEASAALDLGDFRLDGNYSWIVADNRSAGNANFGNWLPRRPRQTANGSIHYTSPFGLGLGAAVRWTGKSYDDAANTLELPSYTLVDLRAEYEISPQVRLFARAENLFDKHYMTAYRYGSLGRSIYVGFRGRF